MDFSADVNVRTLPAGEPLQQYVRVGGRPGPWYTTPGTAAGEVGLWASDARQLTQFKTTLPTVVLETKARQIVDTWTGTKQFPVNGAFTVPTEGGGVQYCTFQGYKIWLAK